MADLSPTAANVLKASRSVTRVGTAGAAITAGDVLYGSTSELLLAQADTSAKATAVGIALCDAAEGQPVVYLVSGGINPGATVTVGEYYVVSSNAAGKMAPLSDLTEDDYVTGLGFATTASNIDIDINVTGVQVPGE